MKRKGWLVPIIVFLISFVFLFSYQQKQEVVSFADTTNLPPIIWSEKSTHIVKVSFASAGKVIEAVREEDNWKLPTSDNRKADALYIYNVMTPFLEPLFEQVVETSPTDLTQYGIDDIASCITLYDANGHDYQIIKGKAFDEKSDYVYAPSTDTIYTMNNTAFRNISTNPNDWSSKELLSFEFANVKKINLTYKGHGATLIPITTESGVTLTSEELDERLANEFMNFLQTTKIQNFITEDADERVLSVYGFNSPLLKCTIQLKTGEVLSLTIGNVNEAENICYTQVNSSPAIVTIPYFNLSQFNILYSELHGKENNQLG